MLKMLVFVIALSAPAFALDGCPDQDPTLATLTDGAVCDSTTGPCAMPQECLPDKATKGQCKCQLFPDPKPALPKQTGPLHTKGKHRPVVAE